MPSDITFYIICAFAVFLVAVSKSGFGNGAGFVASAILATVATPGQAIGILLPLLMLMDVASLRPYWGQWDGPKSRRLILGSIVGIALGTLLYSSVPPNGLRLMLGVLAVLFVMYQGILYLRASNLPKTGFRPWVGYLCGAGAGFTSFVAHAGAPPAMVYLLSAPMHKTTFQATTIIIFWVINALKFIPYVWLGLFTWDSLIIDLYMLPVALFGVWVGVKTHHMLPQNVFFALTYLLLFGSGLRLIWMGVS